MSQSQSWCVGPIKFDHDLNYTIGDKEQREYDKVINVSEEITTDNHTFVVLTYFNSQKQIQTQQFKKEVNSGREEEKDYFFGTKRLKVYDKNGNLIKVFPWLRKSPFEQHQQNDNNNNTKKSKSKIETTNNNKTKTKSKSKKKSISSKIKKRWHKTSKQFKLGQELSIKLPKRAQWVKYKVGRMKTDIRKRRNEIFLFERLPCYQVGGNGLIEGRRVKGSNGHWLFPYPVFDLDSDDNFGSMYAYKYSYGYSPNCFERQADKAKTNNNNNNSNNNNSNNNNLNNNNEIDDNSSIISSDDNDNLLNLSEWKPPKHKFQSKQTLKKKKDELSEETEIVTYKEMKSALELIIPKLTQHFNSQQNKTKHKEIESCMHIIKLIPSHYKTYGMELPKWKKLNRVFKEVLDIELNSLKQKQNVNQYPILNPTFLPTQSSESKIEIKKMKTENKLKVKKDDITYCDFCCKNIIIENGMKKKDILALMKTHHEVYHGHIHYSKCKFVCWYKSRSTVPRLCLTTFCNGHTYGSHIHSQHSNQLIKQRKMDDWKCPWTTCGKMGGNISYNGSSGKFDIIRCATCKRINVATDNDKKIIRMMVCSPSELIKKQNDLKKEFEIDDNVQMDNDDTFDNDIEMNNDENMDNEKNNKQKVNIERKEQNKFCIDGNLHKFDLSQKSNCCVLFCSQCGTISQVFR